MAANINFIAQQQKQVEKRDRSDKKTFIATLVLAVVFALAFGGLTFWENKVKKEIQNILDQQLNTKRQIEAMSTEQNNFLAFYEKLTKLTTLMNKRSHGTTSLVDTYERFTNQNTAVINSTYDYYTQSIDITLACNSVFALPELFALIQAPDFQAQYQAVSLQQLRRGANGQYQLSLSLTL
jgi:predicted PurR-regulated permease PerM